MNTDYDVVVVGAGVVGLSTAYYLGQTSFKSLVLEQFPLGHTRGSSHGHTRLSKISHLNHFASSLLPDAQKTWEEIASKSGRDFCLNTGHLTMCHASVQHKLEMREKSLKKSNQDYEIHRGSDIQNKFPGLHFNDSFAGLFERNGIVIKADKALAALKDEYLEAGGTIHEEEKVLSLDSINSNCVRITTNKQTYIAKSVVITCGPWMKEMSSKLGISIQAESVRVTAYFWKETKPKLYSAENGFPPLMLLFKTYHLYSTPSLEYPGLIKICYHHRSPVDPNQPDVISKHDVLAEKERLEFLSKIIAEHFPFVEKKPALKELYLQTVTPDSVPILDRHPQYPNIIFGGGCSGYGFGLAPEYGRILCELATDKQAKTPFDELTFASHSKSKL